MGNESLAMHGGQAGAIQGQSTRVLINAKPPNTGRRDEREECALEEKE